MAKVTFILGSIAPSSGVESGGHTERGYCHHQFVLGAVSSELRRAPIRFQASALDFAKETAYFGWAARLPRLSLGWGPRLPRFGISLVVAERVLPGFEVGNRS